MGLVEDETGGEWLVEAGDPARKAMNKLKARGMKWLVLPGALLRGTLESTVVEPEPTDTLRRARLRLALELLNE